MKSKSVLESPQKDTLICSVCGKEFVVNDDTKYIIAGGYTCSWKCFSDEVKRQESEKAIQKKIR